MKTEEYDSNERTRKKCNETEINNLPDKEFKAIVVRMLTEPGERIDEQSENFNEELENIKKEPVRVD